MKTVETVKQTTSAKSTVVTGAIANPKANPEVAKFRTAPAKGVNKKTSPNASKALADKKPKVAAAKPAAKPVGETKRRGPTSKLSGKKLTCLKPVDLRTPKNKGKVSFNIILENPGITFEEFLAKGGRKEDALFDLKRNFIKAD